MKKTAVKKTASRRPRARLKKSPLPFVDPAGQNGLNPEPPRAIFLEQPAVYPGTAPKAPGFELPPDYGDTKIALFAKDPWWLYAYWEVAEPDKAREAIRGLGLAVQRTVLRVYELATDSRAAERVSFFDILVGSTTGDWFIDVGQPDKCWMTELGFVADNGRFFALVGSEAVRTPRFGVSDVVDEEWSFSSELFWKIYRASGRIGAGASSYDVRAVVIESWQESAALQKKQLLLKGEGPSSFQSRGSA
ncbi:MAG: DUF4912 domain-containing protein [Candidatus Omnitrophica bacterium]|nr:DUF4912 domain-containing protein [Candidatus Omnitrophota bacterium]